MNGLAYVFFVIGGLTVFLGFVFALAFVMSKLEGWALRRRGRWTP